MLSETPCERASQSIANQNYSITCQTDIVGTQIVGNSEFFHPKMCIVIVLTRKGPNHNKYGSFEWWSPFTTLSPQYFVRIEYNFEFRLWLVPAATRRIYKSVKRIWIRFLSTLEIPMSGSVEFIVSTSIRSSYFASTSFYWTIVIQSQPSNDTEDVWMRLLCNLATTVFTLISWLLSTPWWWTTTTAATCPKMPSTIGDCRVVFMAFDIRLNNRHHPLQAKTMRSPPNYVSECENATVCLFVLPMPWVSCDRHESMWTAFITTHQSSSVQSAFATQLNAICIGCIA